MQIDDEYRLDHDIVSKSLEDILNILSTDEPGLSNPEAKEKITVLAEMIREATTDSYIGEKTVEIETWADACYSIRKHQQYIGGARELCCWIQTASDQIRKGPNLAKPFGKA